MSGNQPLLNHPDFPPRRAEEIRSPRSLLMPFRQLATCEYKGIPSVVTTELLSRLKHRVYICKQAATARQVDMYTINNGGEGGLLKSVEKSSRGKRY